MARVPVAQQSIRQAPDATPFQHSIASAEDFGGLRARAMADAGQKLGAVGDIISKRALQIQVEDNEREARRLDVDFSKAVQTITFGDGDQDQGYYGKRGEAAVGGYQDAAKRIDDARRKLVDSGSNERVKEMFGQQADKRIVSERGAMMRFVAQHRLVADRTVAEARINEAADDAGRAWNNPDVINRSIGIVRGETQRMAAIEGWGPEVTVSKMQEAQTVLHRSVINAALNQDPAAAQAYFDKNKDKIDGRVHTDIMKALEAGTLRQQSQAHEDRIMALGLAEAEAMKAARAIANPKVRDETVARLGNRFAENARIEARADKELTQVSWDVVKKGGSTDDLTPAQLSALPLGVYSSLQAFEARRAKEGRGYAKAADPDTENMLHRLYMDDKAAFAEYDMTQVIGKLDEPKFNYWSAQQRSINKADEREKNKQASYALSDKIALQFMHGARWDIGEKGKDSAKANRVYEAARGVVDTLHAEGKKATADDVTKAMKELFLTGEADGSGIFWDKTGPRAGFLGTDNDGKFILTDIPKQKQQISEVTGVPVDQVEAVAKALRDAKLPVTTKNIRDAYERATARGK